MCMQQFNGIAEKLIRAKENIFGLDSEIERFFQEGEYAVLPENDRKALLEAIEYHKNLVIPPRFGVLVGEIVHHLRSCFDHIVWHFSVGAIDEDTWISFPIFPEKPKNADDRRSFERKIKRVNDASVKSLVEQFQPYNATDPLDHPLLIINDFDIIDKHRELVVCYATGSVAFPTEMQGIIEGYKREHPELDSAEIARHFKGHGTPQPCISFRNFGRREIEPVIPGLMQLFNYTVDAVKRFESL